MAEFAVIIVAGGSGVRAGDGPPKQYRLLDGKPVLRRTVEKFMSCKGLKDIRIVIGQGHEALYRESLAGLGLPAPVTGGATRQESVRNGLLALGALPDHFPVLIHDAARPFVTEATILACVEKLGSVKAVTAAAPVVDTLRHEEDNILTDTVDRKGLWAVQTPQGFRYDVIRTAHETLKGSYTDDTQMVSELGMDVEIVESPRNNIKLTTEDDFRMMASAKNRKTRTGIGYDVHAFGDEAASIRLGGVDIPHTRKLAGHSDADVILHAVTDAIYGTIASGDIGSHFPPSDMRYKNMDSGVFLKMAVDELRAAGGELSFIDTVVICEDPKIGPHRDKIRDSIARLCGLPVNCVSVKATTSEGLGFTGRREGIACQSLVTIEIES